jgi:uncharacterized surface protein with fasciclin (FAS1) repeats
MPVLAMALFLVAGPASAMDAQYGARSMANPHSMMLAPSNRTIADVAASKPYLSTLLAAVKAAGLADLVSGEETLTVLAPSNEAFAGLPAGTVESLLKPENKELLVAILSNHVIAGRYTFTDIVRATLSGPVTLETLGGGKLTVSRQGGMIRIASGEGSVRVIRPNLRANNGVIHVIDGVLLP